MESQAEMRAYAMKRASAKLTTEMQKFSKQVKPFFETIENETFNLKMLVVSFIEKIKSVLMKSNPVEVIEEFEEWLKLFLSKNRKLLEYINHRMIEDMQNLKDGPKRLNTQIEWFREDKILSTRQLINENFEKESNGVIKIDHPMYFRRRFL